MISLLINFIFTLAFACPSGQVEVQKNARLEYLDRGANVLFKQKIEIPAFESEVRLSKQVYFYIEPTSRDRFIPPNRMFKILKSDSHFFDLGNHEIYFGLRSSLPTVNNLNRELGGVFVLCHQDDGPRKI